jgi:PilZ domain
MDTESGILQPLPSVKQRFPVRRHSRARVSADVPLHLTRRVFIAAELVDVSPTGFRVRHQSTGVAPGTVVHAWGFVSARVVWTRTSDGFVESGFELLG